MSGVLQRPVGRRERLLDGEPPPDHRQAARQAVEPEDLAQRRQQEAARLVIIEAGSDLLWVDGEALEPLWRADVLRPLVDLGRIGQLVES